MCSMNNICTFKLIFCLSLYAKLSFFWFPQPMCLSRHGWLIQLFDSPSHAASNCAQGCMWTTFIKYIIIYKCMCCSYNCTSGVVLICVSKTSVTIAKNRATTVHMPPIPWHMRAQWNTRLVCTKTQGRATCDAIFRMTSSCPACCQLSVLYWN